ncbi:MAG: response regulator transcription factor, partial [Balneolaceae bacterium]
MSNRKPSKILIVEDEPSLVFTLRDTLENEGYDIHVVDDGMKAVEAVKEVQPDLMLLDLMLPGKSGYDICKEVRELQYTFPIIMLTARDQEIDKVTGLNIGADDYMTKPFGVKELLARINARLRRNKERSKSNPVDSIELGEIRIDLNNAVVHR